MVTGNNFPKISSQGKFSIKVKWQEEKKTGEEKQNSGNSYLHVYQVKEKETDNFFFLDI